MDTLKNIPSLWRQLLPRSQKDGNKFNRGFAIFWGGSTLSGAIRLAAASARRTGVGLAGVVSSRSTYTLYGEHPGILTIVPVHDTLHQKMRLFMQKAQDPRVTAIGLGSGLSPSNFLNSFNKRILQNLLDLNKPLIIDGGALHPLWFTLNRPLRNVILTPHKGELRRLFSVSFETEVSMEMLHDQLKKCDATIVLKGPQTLIARANQPWVLQESAPAHLATAGTGDVLMGVITSLVAQGMPAFEASAAGVWIHAAAAKNAGSFMIAEDLIPHLQTVMRKTYGLN